MKQIDIKELDFNSMIKINHSGANSDIYFYKNYCIKIFNNYRLIERINTQKKFELLDNIELDNVLKPKVLIMKDNTLQGYIMDKFDGETLYDYFSKNRFVDAYEIIRATKNVSLILRLMHSNGLKCQDVSFVNFLINIKGEIAFCDFDSVSYKGFDGAFVPTITYDFLKKYKHHDIIIDENLDKLSLILAFYLTIYHNRLEYLTEEEYESLYYDINSLQNLNEVAMSLLYDKGYYVPYIDEFLDEEHFVIDREKQISIEQIKKYGYKII